MNKKWIHSEKIRALIAVAAFALVIALIAMVVSPASLHFDLTDSHIVTIPEEALSSLSAVSEPVSLYLIKSEESDTVWLDELVGRYAAANDNITSEVIDSSSSRVSKFSALLSGQDLTKDCILVVSEKRSVVLPNGDLFSYEYDPTAYYYLGVVNYTSAELTAQDALCRAIDYVTRDDMPVLYCLDGHGESGWDSTLNELCLRLGIALETLNLKAGDPVPDDAAAVFLCNPASPVSEETAAALLDYLKDGGDMLLMTNYGTDFSNLESLVEYYGMARRNCFVLEDDTSYLYNPSYQYSLVPEIRKSAYTDSLIAENRRVVLPASEAIVRSDVHRAGLTTQPILVTSDHAYIKADPNAIATLSREEEDESGRFLLGMAATEDDTHLVWISSASVLSEGAEMSTNGGNSALIASILNQMFDFPAQPEAIPSVSILETPVSIPNAPAIIALIALPLICLIVGVILHRRRAR